VGAGGGRAGQGRRRPRDAHGMASGMDVDGSRMGRAQASARGRRCVVRAANGWGRGAAGDADARDGGMVARIWAACSRLISEWTRTQLLSGPAGRRSPVG
jgi:hypothetical protein